MNRVSISYGFESRPRCASIISRHGIIQTETIDSTLLSFVLTKREPWFTLRPFEVGYKPENDISYFSSVDILWAVVLIGRSVFQAGFGLVDVYYFVCSRSIDVCMSLINLHVYFTDS